MAGDGSGLENRRAETPCEFDPHTFRQINQGARMLMTRFSLPEGWKMLQAPLLEKIDKFEAVGGKVLQVKEKFGTLRVYTIDSPNGDFLDTSIEEKLAQTMCMDCGEPASEFAVLGWVGPRCDKHATKHLNN